MSVDKYAVCPCGSGKKIKFCKCKDSVGQMDQVLTMIEGGQVGEPVTDGGDLDLVQAAAKDGILKDMAPCMIRMFCGIDGGIEIRVIGARRDV